MDRPPRTRPADPGRGRRAAALLAVLAVLPAAAPAPGAPETGAAPPAPAARGAIHDRRHRLLAGTPDPAQPLARVYPFGTAAAHLIGRVKRAGGGLAGEFGVERQFDAELRTGGRAVVLALDLELQLAADRALARVRGAPRGAAVVLAVRTGEVLALASKPTFALGEVSPVLPAATKARIDAEGGWFNFATQGLFPPGSTFKLLTDLAAFRAGVLHDADIWRCEGGLEVGDRRFACHEAGGHGDLRLREALARSCNVFHFRVGLAAGAEAIAAEARRFHVGEPTGIDLPFETRRMLVPDAAWKKADGRGAWTAGDTVNLSIGQGFVRWTPLQAACAVASLARRETRTVPTVLRAPDRNPAGPHPREPLDLPEDQYAALVAGMQAVVASGTGREAQVPGVSMAGKTGTAQVARREGTTNIAWFVAFAPVERPQIAIAVALEGGTVGEEFAGGAQAAPVVRELVEQYFARTAPGGAP